LLSSDAGFALAQTREQLRAEGEFIRAVIRALDAKDCKLAIRLIDKRQADLRLQAQERTQGKSMRDGIKSDGDLRYLAAQMEGLTNRRAIMARECR